MVRVAQMELARAGREGRRRRCTDIVDDERQRDAPHFGLCGIARRWLAS